MLVDSHTHLDFLPEGRSIEQVLADAKDAGVDNIVCIGTSVEASIRCVEIATKYSTDGISIFASCGIHPEDGKADIKKFGLKGCVNELEKILKQVQDDKQVVAIGECGLDYYFKSDKQEATSYREKEFQRKLFIEQIKLSQKLKLPLIVHCRNAWEEIFFLMTKLQTPASQAKRGEPNSKLCGVFHSWTGDWEAAKKALDLGFYISFSGIVTFKNAQNIQEVAKKTPIERIILETDSPFLSPEPMRGKQNEPKNVKIVAEFVAGLRNDSFDNIVTNTSANAKTLFNF